MSASTVNSTARNKHSSPSNDNYNASSIDITKEEFTRIKDALKNEEFRKLFFDYCDEIQDPENRKIYEAEIRQLEAERGVEVKFVNPEPGFVIKTSVDGALKCFVNVAKSAEVAKPSSEVCINPETGTRGLNWALPMAQAPPHDDLDAQGKRCRVFDVVFHPDALYLAQRNEAFRKCLVDTALDAVEREYKVHLDRANLKFPKMQFKGVARPTVIRKLAKNAPAEALEPHPLEDIYPTKPTVETSQPKVLPMKTQSTAKPEFSTPKYVIKYRRDVDLAEYTNELDAKLNVTMPRELIVEIELPLLHSTADCTLDVTTKSLYLLSERAGAKYRLSLVLPHAVDDKLGSARFDTDTRRLCITLPVLQQDVEQQRGMHETLLYLNREDSGVESDMREEMNSNEESPIEELSDTVEESPTEEANKDEASTSSPTSSPPVVAPSTTTPFLKNSVHYLFPTKFDCNVLDSVMSLVLHVRNVQPESIAMHQQAKQLHLQFISIGAGYYPTHYAFFLQLPEESSIKIASAEAEAWENNVVLNVELTATSEHLNSYLAGLDSTDLKEYNVQGKFQVAHNSRQRKKSPPKEVAPLSLSSSLDISVERSECERSVEIEIKPRVEQPSTCAANTTDEEALHVDSAQQVQQKKLNKKQKRKNKKRRSLSESACDDIKAAYHHQQQQQQQHQQQHQQKQKASFMGGNQQEDIDSSPERAEELAKKPTLVSSCVAVPTTAHAQQRKQRSYSECRDSVASGSASTLATSFKGILKHYSRYAPPRRSMSDSCSSIDECVGYSSSVDAGVGSSSLRFSQSFSDIPEEHVAADLSESCKKTVRFNEVIKKQIFRLDSSILGQRKKNQKRRDRKQRALHRRHSEGDSADYEDNKPVALQADEQYFKLKSNHTSNLLKNSNTITKKSNRHDSGVDLSNGESCSDTKGRPRLESESSLDMDAAKNSMMFEMDM